jgi:glycosyltransferase involved in cell wall biosynthesis
MTTSILQIAYSCKPKSGSEDGAGWGFLKGALCRDGNVILLTRKKNIDSILENLTSSERQKLEVIEFDLPVILIHSKRFVPFGSQFNYLIWQFAARSIVRKIVDEFRPDVVHHVTWASDSLPTAAKAAGSVPVIWGPVGGIQKAPKRLLKYLGFRGLCIYFVRTLVTTVMRHYFARSQAIRSSLVLCQNDETLNYFNRVAPAELFPNIYLEDSYIFEGLKMNSRESSKLITVGRLIPLKGHSFIMELLSSLPENWTLDVIGVGSDSGRMKRLAKKFGISNRVSFLGSYSNPEAIKAISDATFFLFPSLHDSAGFVLAEAQSVNTPVIAFDLPGPRAINRGGITLIDINSKNLIGEWKEVILNTSSTKTNNLESWGVKRISEFYDSFFEKISLNR